MPKEKKFVKVVINGYSRYADIVNVKCPKDGEGEKRISCYASPVQKGKPVCTIPVSRLRQATIF